MTHRLQACLLLLLIAAAPATQGTNAPIFEEPFDGKLKDDWSWFREDAGAWRVEDKSLHMKVSSGSLWDKSNDAKNVLLLPAPPMDITAEVTITSTPKDQAEQATLLYYVDEDNYTKLCKEFLNGKQNVVIAREENGKGQFIAGKAAEGETLRLRITRRGDEVTGEYSTDDGKQWNEVGKCAVPAGKEFKIGLVAHGMKNGEREAVFKDFRVTKAQ